MNGIYFNEKESKQVFSLIKELNDLLEELMTENKYLKKDRDYYKGLYLKHRENMDKD